VNTGLPDWGLGWHSAASLFKLMVERSGWKAKREKDPGSFSVCPLVIQRVKQPFTKDRV
jgi:hypothetical protein